VSARVAVYVGGVACAAALALFAAAVLDGGRVETGNVLAFALVTVVLQLYSLRLPGSGRLSVGTIGAVACAFAVGAPWAMAIAAVSGIVLWIRSRGLLHRAIFDVSQFALATGAAAAVYAAGASGGVATEIGAAVLAGIAYAVVNQALVCTAIGLSEGVSPFAVWVERFRVARYHALAIGPVALGWAAAAAVAGPVGIVVFAAVPAALLVTLKPLVARLRPAPA
jgi:hypothetical protein